MIWSGYGGMFSSPPVTNIRDYAKFKNPLWLMDGRPEQIGVDLDGVLFDFIGAVHKRMPSVPSRPKSWEVSDDLDVKEKELFNHYLDSPDFWLTVSLYPGALEFVEWLKESGYRPIIITSRNSSVKEVTEERVNRLFEIPKEDVIFEKNKLSAALGLGLKTHIEDSPKFLEEMNGLIDLLAPIRPWNSDYLSMLGEKDTVTPYLNFGEAKKILIEKRRKRNA